MEAAENNSTALQGDKGRKEKDFVLPFLVKDGPVKCGRYFASSEVRRITFE